MVPYHEVVFVRDQPDRFPWAFRFLLLVRWSRSTSWRVARLGWRRFSLSRRRPAERFHEKASFFYRSAPAAPSAFFAVLHPRYLRTDLEKKKLVENSMFAIRFLCVFF